jgi:integrase
VNATLWELCSETYFPRRLKIRSAQTRRHYLYALNDFARFLGRVPSLADLNDDTVTLWLSDLLTRGESPDDPRSVETATSKVGRVLTLWRFLACRRMVEEFPTVELPASPEPMPIALDEAQLYRLFESAQCRPGFVAGIPARYWWPAIFGFVFSTSERRGGTFATRWEWVNLDNRIAVIPAAVRKGKRKTATYPLWDEVCWLLNRIVEPRRDLVFPWDKSETSFYKHYSKILVDAQIPDDRRHKLQGLRVTHNTWHRVMTGRHSPLLMHSSTATSERHYEDKKMTAMPSPKLLIPWQLPPEPPRAA